ncbi:sulfite exporter TauE/SafE family protein [Undibacterium griseum]|uniref:Sulfite exporter TauE/SafE family protein n=1 Tax=Undibacterium griseum TaxID=2762295 RepID=A0ABR6YLW9_9BURK|nr:sulfite exporter TauE/SafE family protein [Undibacterium griseum]MBC3884873.1 sulfite exporter TauE/SafE family protein [Undibacterium griseum]
MLTFPLAFAAITAGLAGGIHCVGMCGGISSILSKQASSKYKTIPLHTDVSAGSKQEKTFSPGSEYLQHQVRLHAGRISTYMIVGAIFGGLGSAGIVFKPSAMLHQILFVLGNIALILLGLRIFGLRMPFSGRYSFFLSLQQTAFSFLEPFRAGLRHPYLTGLAWGGLPCGLLYSVAPFALLSGDAFSGALLMLLFGLSALPHLLFSQGIYRLARQTQLPHLIRYIGAATLVVIGLIGLWYLDMEKMPGFLCVLPGG